MRILVVEDNKSMARFISRGLTEHGHAVDICHSAHEGETLGSTEPYDLIILDVMLPDQDGILTCKNLRRRGAKSPILLLTALSATTDKVTGLDAGADDYMTKPFEFEELLARTRALMRRGQAQEAGTLKYEDIEMNLLARTVVRSHKKIKLTSKEFALLEYLLRNPCRVLTRTSIGEHVWDVNFDRESNVIDVYVSSLRRKIEGRAQKRLIHTIIGAGYMLNIDGPDL